MATKLSRRKLSQYAAAQLMAGDTSVYDKLAAYLVQTRRVRELPLITRDIEDALLGSGIAVATVTSAAPLSEKLRSAIKRYITEETGATSVTMRETIDEAVIGGLRLTLPGRELDSTVQQRLRQLMKQKVTE